MSLKNYNYKDIKTIYKYKFRSKNYIYYICQYRKKCEGKGKIHLNKKLFIITNLCNRNIEHDDIDYEEFVR